jgi:hypothetical protein
MIEQETIQEHLMSDDPTERGCALIAGALLNVAYQLRCLGNGNASTSMGAIEGLGVAVKEGLDGIASVIEMRGEP